jgi:predicted Zn-dependent protease
MPAGFAAEIVRAFDAWSAVANLIFTQVADPGVGWQSAGAGAVDIRITGHVIDGAFGVLAHAFFPPANGGAAAGDMHFDIAENWTIGNAGFDIFTVAAHEIGHAIGLGHTNVANSLMNPFYAFSATGPQADDILGAQAIYGAPVAAVPEPATGMLLLLGMGLLVGMRRKRV